MIGLLIKDLYTLKRQLRIVVLISVIYFAVAVLSKNLGMFTGIAMMYAIVLPITSMAYDEQCKWDRYALATPLSRTTIVLSKYVLGVLLNIVGVLLVCAAHLTGARFGLSVDGELLPTVFGMSTGALAVMSVILPLMYKFGVEKARLIMVIVFLVPFLLVMAASRFQLELSLDLVKQYVYLLPVAVIGMILVSLYCSIRIYKGKEF